MAYDYDHDRDEFLWVKLLFGAVVLVGVAMLLIEWNARRQAAAMTREMLRPAIPDEQVALNAAMEQAFPAESAAEQEAMLRQVWNENSKVRATQESSSALPLNEGERCISGQRFRRVTSGWDEIGTC